MLLNTKSTFRSLQTFKSLEELKANTTAILKNFSQFMTPATINVFKIIGQFSRTYFGVCYLSKESIAERLNISTKTVQRAFNALIKLGIIKRYETKRAGFDRRQSSNAIVIQPILTVLPEDFYSCPTECPTIIYNQIKNNKYTNDTEIDHKNYESKEYLIKKGLVTKLPTTLKNALAPFFDAEELYKFSGIVFKAKASVDKTIMLEEYETEFYNSILSVINTYRNGKVYSSFEGLLYRAIESTTRSILLKNRLSNAFGI